MNRKVLTILLCAFLVAAGCAFLVYRVVGTRMNVVHKPTTVRVVAAAGDIKLGTILTDANLSTVELAGPLPKGAILKKEDAVGRGALSDLYQGETIVDRRLAPVGAGAGLASTIPQGMRACAVKVDEVVGVAGFVTPGMRVDVLVSGNPSGSPSTADGSKVKTLLQNIEVLSAGSDIKRDAEGKPQQVPVVNLLVTPEQAEALSLASSEMHIQLVLRNPTDTEISRVHSTAMSNLFADNDGLPVKPRVVTARHLVTAPHMHSIEVFNGALRSEQKFPDGVEK